MFGILEICEVLEYFPTFLRIFKKNAKNFVRPENFFFGAVFFQEIVFSDVVRRILYEYAIGFRQFVLEQF